MLRYLSVVFILFCSTTFAQRENYRYVNLFIDDSVVFKWADSLLRSTTKEVIVYQTIKPFDSIQSADGFLTFLIWQQHKSSKMLIVTDSGIYIATISNANPIFNYKYRKRTYVSAQEQTLKFTPPILFGNAVYFFSKTNIDYFDLAGNNGEPLTYQPINKQQQGYRKDLFEIIYQVLNKQQLQFKAISNYSRKFN